MDLQPIKPPYNSEPTILVAEDEPILLESLADLMSDLDCKVLTAQNGQEIIDQVSKIQVHAILSDINMPIMSGLEALSLLRARGCDTPYVFLTGYGDSKNITAALRLGAFDFQEKPFDDVALVHTMKAALDYGLALSDLDQKINSLVKNMNVPDEVKQQLTHAHRVVGSMKILNQINSKKNKNS